VSDLKEKEKKEIQEEESDLIQRFKNPTRRDFLKGLAIGAGGLALAPMIPKGTTEAVDLDYFPMKQVSQGQNVQGGRIVHDYRVCTGCQTCEMSCAMYNEKVASPARSRIKIYRYEPAVFVGIVCQQCSDRPCVNACPVEPDKDGFRALYVNPKNSALEVNKARCIHCSACVNACKEKRNGNIYMNSQEYPDGYCVLCNGDPQCVKDCPFNALMVVPRTTDGMYGNKGPDVLAKWAIETLYGGPKTIVENGIQVLK
jgi:Fe-S-cluster-containing hydrogenase component 2